MLKEKMAPRPQRMSVRPARLGGSPPSNAQASVDIWRAKVKTLGVGDSLDLYNSVLGRWVSATIIKVQSRQSHRNLLVQSGEGEGLMEEWLPQSSHKLREFASHVKPDSPSKPRKKSKKGALQTSEPEDSSSSTIISENNDEDLLNIVSDNHEEGNGHIDLIHSPTVNIPPEYSPPKDAMLSELSDSIALSPLSIHLSSQIQIDPSSSTSVTPATVGKKRGRKKRDPRTMASLSASQLAAFKQMTSHRLRVRSRKLQESLGEIKPSSSTKKPAGSHIEKRGKRKEIEPVEASFEETKCVCGLTDEDGLMIQCDTCNHWMHNGCVGLSNNPDHLPDKFTCPSCRSEPLKAPIDPPPRIAMLLGLDPEHSLAQQKREERAELKISVAMLSEFSPEIFTDLCHEQDAIDHLYAYVNRPFPPYFPPDDPDHVGEQYALLLQLSQETMSAIEKLTALQDALSNCATETITTLFEKESLKLEAKWKELERRFAVILPSLSPSTLSTSNAPSALVTSSIQQLQIFQNLVCKS